VVLRAVCVLELFPGGSRGESFVPCGAHRLCPETGPAGLKKRRPIPFRGDYFPRKRFCAGFSPGYPVPTDGFLGRVSQRDQEPYARFLPAAGQRRLLSLGAFSRLPAWPYPAAKSNVRFSTIYRSFIWGCT